MSRWQVERLTRALGFERLKSSSLEAKLSDLRAAPTTSGTPGSTAETATTGAAGYSLVPSLEADELTSSLAEVTEDSAEYATASQELSIKFDLVRKPPREGSARYYWVALLHGGPGILSFPPAMASRAGETILSHRGQAVDDVRVRRSVQARFKVGGFVERAGSEPLFVSLLVYDAKGSLVLRRRLELSLRRSGDKGGGGDG